MLLFYPESESAESAEQLTTQQTTANTTMASVDFVADSSWQQLFFPLYHWIIHALVTERQGTASKPLAQALERAAGIAHLLAKTIWLPCGGIQFPQQK